MMRMAIRTIAAGSVFVTLWLAGNVVLLRSGSVWTTPIEQQIHLSIVLALTVAVVFHAASVRGSFEDRIKQVVVAATVMFGAYALIILVGRYFFSRSILATSFPTSILVGLAIIWLRDRRNGVKAVVLAPLVQALPEGLGKVDVLDDPATDFRPYDLVLIDLHAPVSAEWANALSRAMLCGCRVRHIEDHVEELSGAVSIHHFELEHLPATEHDPYIPIKRLMDIAGALLLAPIAVPLVVLAAVGVLITSGWPVFFIRPRVGLGGAHFHMWKLRTMRASTDSRVNDATVPGDSRVTAFGRLLRRSRIDELPQLWNVLKGDMSLIGPRPEMVEFHNAYVEAEPKFAYRCLVRPGITGWAQVNAPPSANTEEALFKARYDLYYIKRQSLGIDLRVAALTLWTLIHGGGVR